MFTWIVGSIFVPTWLHFGSPNPPTSSQKSIPRGINFLIDFYIDFSSILLVFGSQLGAMLATFSFKMEVPCGVLSSFLGGLCYLSMFVPSWPPLGSILEGVGVDFQVFCWILGSILEGFGVHFGFFWWPFGSHVLNHFNTFWLFFLKLPLVICGLVGLRKASRISLNLKNNC